MVKFNATMEHHVENVKLVFWRTHQYELEIMVKKCELCIREMSLLGQNIEGNGV